MDIPPASPTDHSGRISMIIIYYMRLPKIHIHSLHEVIIIYDIIIHGYVVCIRVGGELEVG